MNLRVRKTIINGGRPRKGYLATVTMDVDFGIHAMQFRDLRLIQMKDKRIILAMPSRQGSNGDRHEIVRPLNGATRDALTAAAVEEYHRAVEMGRVPPPGDV